MRRILLFTFIAGLFFISFAQPHFIYAEPSRLSQSLQIIPVIKEINVNRGSDFSVQLSLRNMTAKDMVFEPIVNDFRAKDESGTPKIILGEPVLPTNISMVSWVAPIASITLPANQTKIIDVRLSVPKDAEPGGYYGVIRFSGSPSALSGSNVSISASTGTLLLIRVNGKINEHLEIKDFFTMRANKRSGLFEKAPTTFVERLYNPSNIHLKPKGELIVKDMFGHVIGSIGVNGSSGNILPLSTRRFEQTLNKKRMYGRYTATLNLTYGADKQTLNRTIIFWVIPYKVVCGILALLIVMLFVAVKVRKRKIRL